MKRREVYIPSPEEIRKEAAKIREEWSEYERGRRLVGNPEPWTPPEIKMPQIQ